MKLSFVPNKLHVIVEDSGEIDFLTLYRTIREWEASSEGIVFSAVLEGSGNIQLPGGSRTPRTMIFLGGWKLKSDEQITIVNGYVTGRNKDGYYNPIAEESRDNIRILSSEKDETDFVPTEAQKRYALEQGRLYSEDWEVLTEPRPTVRRKGDASERRHKVFGLYWFLKQEWLRNAGLRKFHFPIQGDNRAPREGLVREWQWSSDWEISRRDLKYLEDGPLYIGRKEIVPPLATEDAKPDSALVDEQGPDIQNGNGAKRQREVFERISGWLKRIWRKRHRLTPRSEATKKAVTIGIVTVLPEEYAAIKCQLDNQLEYVATDGRKNNSYLLGTMPAFGNDLHTVAAAMTAMGNNPAAIRASALLNDFPNLQKIIMVGIAGAAPNPDDIETHVRLGDVVVSGDQGVIQYDFIKDSGDAKIEDRHKPRAPSAELIRAYHQLVAEYICGNRPWMDEIKRAPPALRDSRPAAKFDKLADSNDPSKFLDHPSDKTRYPDEPKIFMGTIGAANKHLKDAKQRDQLRDKYGIRAIEMESSGISDAADEYDIPYFTIRGTCDYCDANKNDDWHVYAATVAGAYCRALLRKTPACRQFI